MDAMIQAWRLNKNDTMLSVLPLHHVHGMINCVMTPLNAGGTVVLTNKFDPEQVNRRRSRFHSSLCIRHGIIYWMIVIQQLLSSQLYQQFISN